MTTPAHRCGASLARLAQLAQTFEPLHDAIDFGGTVTDIGSGFCRLAGLDRNASLHDILLAGDCNEPVAELVQINNRSATAILYRLETKLIVGQTLFRRSRLTVAPTAHWLGRVINAFGEAVDDRGPLPEGGERRPVISGPPSALGRRLVTTGIVTGVKAIDIFTPICIGQRIGIFAGSGVGKSTLLAMLAHADQFDVAVIALIGERGREVREFVDTRIDRAADKTIVVVATSDESALLRRTAANTAMAVAEYFRDQGSSVLLIMDSITRFALACREIAIAAGEPPVSRGFPPSVFTDLPRLLERAGPGSVGGGDITGLFAVLVDGDDHNDPIADAVRGIVDGHIVLDRAIATQGRYPAVDIPASLSRLAHVALAPDRRILARRLRAMIARFEETRDLRAMGGYQSGLDPDLDTAVAMVPILYASLAQSGDNGPCADAFKEIVDALKQHFPAGT